MQRLMLKRESGSGEFWNRFFIWRKFVSSTCRAISAQRISSASYPVNRPRRGGVLVLEWEDVSMKKLGLATLLVASLVRLTRRRGFMQK